MSVPGAHDIERLAVALAAAEGHFWPKLPSDAAFRYRTLAHAAIVSWRDKGELAATQIVRDTLDLGVDGLRRAAKALDEIIDQSPRDQAEVIKARLEGLVQDLYQRATGLSNIDRVLAAELPSAPDLEDEPI